MINYRIKTKKYAETAALILLLIAAFLLSVSRKYRGAVNAGIELWAACVLPALFPYLVITYFISSLEITGKIAARISPFTRKVFNVNGNAGYALFISLLSGYPMGAKTVSDLKNSGFIGEAESVRASALCSSSSPVFLIGSVGNITFNDPFFGLCLFAVHLISVLIVGFIFSFYKRKERPQKSPPVSFKKTDNLLYESVYSSVLSVLVVGGIITVFYLLTEMLAGVGILNALEKPLTAVTGNSALSEGIINGFFECTKGVKILAGNGVSLFTLPITAAVCGFGGLSVIAQSTAFLKKAKIKTAPFLLSKTLAAIINFAIGLIFSLVFFR